MSKTKNVVIDDLNKEQTIKYLAELMATVQMAHFKGREVGVRVHEVMDEGSAAISVDLYDFGGTGDDLIDGLHGVTPYHGEDTESETGWVFNIGYDPDDEEPLYFLFLPDGADDAYTILPTTLPEEVLKNITAWLEKAMVPAGVKSEELKVKNLVTKAKEIIALWSDWCMDWDDENLWLDYMVKYPKGHCNRRHLQEKWDYCYEKYGNKAAMTMFWRELDNDNRAILVEYVTTQWHKN